MTITSTIAPHTALVYRPGSLGDTLIALPALAAIRRHYPEHRLTLLTERTTPASRRVSPWTILDALGWFEGACFYDVRARDVQRRAANVALALRLRRQRFDHVFSLAPPRTAWQRRRDAWIFRGVVDAGHYHDAAACLPAAEPAEHEGLRLLRVVDPSATEESLRAFRLQIPSAADARSRELLRQIGVDAHHVMVAVAPGSARSSTMWPIERFGAVGRALLKRFVNIVLLAVGGAGEREVCERLCASWGPRARNLAGLLTVFESASVLARCATFIGNDSGATHLAAMCGIPAVAVFSARTAPGRWDPIGRDHIVLRDRPGCSGCMLEDCLHENTKCLTHIQAEPVFSAAVSQIESRRWPNAL